MKNRKCLTYGIVCLAAIVSIATEKNAWGQGTVTDTLTGLVWEQSDNQQWLNWYDACAYCENSALGGYTDWRLPEMEELRTIADYTRIDMALEPRYQGYSAFKSQIYWSNTEYVGYEEAPFLYSWGVSFYAGAAFPKYKVNHHSVRCVRGSVFVPFDPVVETAGVVKDTVSNLRWQNNEVVIQNWENAALYCENLSLGGYTDWRLPNVDELQSIIDYTSFRPAVHEIFKGNTPNSTFWTKTPYAKSAFHYWGVNFENGTVSGNSQQNRKETANCVRCVQGEEIIVDPGDQECDPGVFSSLTVTLMNALPPGGPMANFPVQVEGQTVNSDTNGIAQFNYLRKPSAVIHIAKVGYVEVNQSVAIVCGEANAITIGILELDAGALRGDIRFILTWGAVPRDLDSHLSVPGQTPEIYFGNKKTVNDPVSLDLDDTDGYGPETITVRKLNGSYITGDYLYWVINFPEGSATPSIGSQRQYIFVMIYQGDKMIGVFQPPRAEEQNVGNRWNVVSMNISSAGLVSFTVASTAGDPRFDPTPYEYDFGTVYLEDSQSTPGIVNLSNLGTGNLNVSGMILSDTTNFILQSSCGSTTPTIGPGSTCSVSLLFSPRRVGQFDEFLTILSNDPYYPTKLIPITATVLSNLTTIPTTQTMLVGSTVTFKITGGTPPYSVYSPNSSAQASLVQSGPGETFPSTLKVTSTEYGYLPITVSDSNSNSVMAWVNMVSTLPIWAYFTATPTLGYQMPMSVQFTNQSTATSGITGYLWNFGDGGTSAEANPTHSYAAEGSYTVSLKVTAGSASETITRTDYITVFGRGDLNCDGDVDLADAVLAMDEQLYNNVIKTLCFDDFDNDNKIGLGELLYILQKVAGIR